ncbi:MAG: Tol-Pal system beta propeller repeat protein TolB [Candidatus Sumerlaeota bacterium]|nr:Tol-Pal system beta propeller repeat protein TolB [Candidatus Sumerlaeota bacterium]
MLRKTWIALAGLCALLTPFVPLAPGAEVEADIGVVRAQEGRTVSTIAIPSFQPGQGSARQLEPGVFNTIIYNDLEISGYFKQVGDRDQQGLIEDAAARDRKSGVINFVDWRALQAQFLVVAEYQIAGDDTLSIDCKLYSVNEGQRVLGKRYTQKAAEYRALAHWIADEIVQAVTGVRGIASTQVAYVSRQGQNKEIFLCDADGKNPRQATSDKSLDATPTWGANATELYYTSYKDYNPDMCGVYTNGSKSWFISRRSGSNLSPDWSPAVQLIAAMLSKDGNAEIYTMDRNGQGLTRLTTNKAIDGSPSWSPNAGEIAFVSDRTGHPHVYIMNADGTNPRRITFKNYQNVSPDWSPKGDRIAFTSQVSYGDDYNIYTMNVEGEDWKQLTNGGGNNEDASWAPDNEHLVFSSDRTGSYQLYIMNSDGTNVRQITFQGESHSPDWGPYPPTK